MLTILEVEPEVASKIQARARERGVSVDVYLRELIEEKGAESKRSNWLSSQERVRMLREWASGHSANTPLLSDDAISRESLYGERVNVLLGGKKVEGTENLVKRWITESLLIIYR